MTDQTTTPDLDRALGFTIPARHARGRAVRLGPTLDAILSAHAYPPAIEKLLAEALTLTALIGATLKDPAGQLTMQTQTEDGIVKLLVCDWRGGEVRGYVQYDADKLASAPADPTLFALFGPGYLAITFDLASTNERYQGIVPLDGATLAEAAQSYFYQSEQIPTLVHVGMQKDAHGKCIAGGLLLQHLPEGEEGRERLHTKLDHPEWEHVEALGQTIAVDELADAQLPLETLLWRLFNEESEVRVLDGQPVSRGCRCTVEHIRSVLERFPLEQRLEMADERGLIAVDCAFCSTVFPLRAEDLAA
ncbi:Hsp33 family molecular chaperone HslO [Sphingomonas sp. NPDC079357]|uniref:Hsp33 family molecular chaperone HslO n=1 Tax=Sphingomonas sp. NPDC079357 TaxID=3364518 RepID=UPI00384F9BCC